MAKQSAKDLALFAQVNAAFPAFAEWLRAEETNAVRGMAGRDPVLIYRAQGDHARLTEIIDLLTNAKTYLRP